MTKKNKTEEVEDREEREEDEESDDEDTEDESESDESEDDESEGDEDEDDSEDDSESDEHLDEDEEDEIDADEEMRRERKGKPDPKIAREAFKERKGKREGDEDEDDKPLTKRELQEMLENDRKERRESDALAIAQTLTKKPKVAALLVEKWKNRRFPEHLTLQEQMVEVYGATYAKKLLGENKELIRALGNKSRVNRDGSSTHRDGLKSNKGPKGEPADIAAIKASGFEWKNNRWEKKLANGGLLIRDPRTQKTIFQRPK